MNIVIKKIWIFIIKNLPEFMYPLILNVIYVIKVGKKLNLKNPKTYTEKLQWIKIYDKNSIKTMLADKYEVREYVKNKIGEKFLIPVLGIWNNFDDINFNDLPNKFILKVTHGCHMNIIVKDKSKLDKEKIKEKINQWLNINLAYIALELQYKNIKPRIIAEQYIEAPNDNLRDYKIMLFNGEPKIILIDDNRFTNHSRTFYDINWNFLPFYANDAVLGTYQEKPAFIDEIIEFAKKLSCGFLHERIDFYFANNNIYFGEFTLTPWSGLCKFFPEEYDLKLGDLIKLSVKK